MAYIGKSPDGTGVRARYYFTATGGETSLSGADDNASTLSFSDGAYVDVYLNGVLLVAGTDYNTTTTNTISGLAALAASDIVEIIVYDVFTVADTVSASAGGTFSGNVSFSDNVKAQFGASNDLKVYHDATGAEGVNGAGSYIEENGAGNLWIMGAQFVSIEKADGTNRVLQADTTNGDIELKYQDSTRLTTTSTGIDVTGVATGDFNDNRQCVMAFMLTSGKSGDQNPITGWANMATQLSGDGAGEIIRGGSITESSGVFSFPFTGLWQIEFFASLNSSGADGTIQYNINSTTNNSTYSPLVVAKESAGSGSYKAFAKMKGLFNVSATSTHKVRFQQSSFSSHTSEGSTTEALTYAIFTWLGDAS